MISQDKLQQLAVGLNGATGYTGLKFQADQVPGETEAVRVTLQDREEFPIYIMVDDNQILCMTYLWKESEIDPAKRTLLLEALLTMNIPMPLSAFSKVGNQYVIFGALSIHFSINEIIEEVEILSDNTLMVIEELEAYLLH